MKYAVLEANAGVRRDAGSETVPVEAATEVTSALQQNTATILSSAHEAGRGFYSGFGHRGSG